MPEEFLGIHLLYLNSKILIWKTMTRMLTIGVILMGGYVVYQNYKVEKMRYEMEQGDHVTCDDGYIAKVVEEGRVTCLMLRVPPGSITFPKNGNYLRRK